MKAAVAPEPANDFAGQFAAPAENISDMAFKFTVNRGMTLYFRRPGKAWQLTGRDGTKAPMTRLKFQPDVYVMDFMIALHRANTAKSVRAAIKHHITTPTEEL
jgi:hypothetical protein